MVKALSIILTAALFVALSGCLPETHNGMANTADSIAKGADTANKALQSPTGQAVVGIVSTIPGAQAVGPAVSATEGILGGIAALAGAFAAWQRGKAKEETVKKKAYKSRLPKDKLDEANKEIHGDEYCAEKSK
jgi:hypothetical protein